MQVRGVKAKEVTPMDKLLPGLTGATNSRFVNEPGLADQICGGCAAICLFNQASNAPGFGGGFKAGLRGSAPIATLIQGRHLRETVRLNILSRRQLGEIFLEYKSRAEPPPTWVQPIEQGALILSGSIGLLRGLFWQPAHIELSPAHAKSKCYCCGRENIFVYTGFSKAKFNYTVKGLWPHPHSPTMLSFKNNQTERKIPSFTTPAPTWTKLSSFVLHQEVNQGQKEGHQPAAVVIQAQELFSRKPDRIRLAAGGYRNKQASILERRHELLDLNKGWHQRPEFIKEIVELGLGYKSALRKTLYFFSKGIKEIKGAGLAVQETGESQFYRRTDQLMQKTLAQAHFEDPDKLALDKDQLRSALKQHCKQIFKEQTAPYLNDPELIRTMAVARRKLLKHLKAVEPEF
jgi:CRISPR system Cascade subunit CasA